jgi:hypothetical protein|tara:strand:- start:2238 stop:2765 length:528 start_codon:yes stop_codon:yes gene_type:complete
MSNLRLINETLVTSDVSFVNITDLFSSDYDVYQITFSEVDTDTTAYIYMRLINTAGSVITSSNYDYGYSLPDSTVGAATSNNTGQTSFLNINYFSNVLAESGVNTITLFNPYSTSSYTYMMNEGAGFFSSRMNAIKYIGLFDTLDSIGGVQFSVAGNSSYNISKAKIRTYGLRVD